MAEVTNEELYKKIVEATNLILSDAHEKYLHLEKRIRTLQDELANLHDDMEKKTQDIGKDVSRLVDELERANRAKR